MKCDRCGETFEYPEFSISERTQKVENNSICRCITKKNRKIFIYSDGQQPVQQSVQDGGWLLGRPVSSREEFLAIPSDLYGRPTYCPDLRSGVIYCKRLNPDTCESYVQEFYSPEAWRQMQAQQAQQTAAPTQQYVPIEQYNTLVHRLDELEKWQKSFSKPATAAKKGE